MAKIDNPVTVVKSGDNNITIRDYIQCSTKGIELNFSVDSDHKVEVKYDYGTYVNDKCVFGLKVSTDAYKYACLGTWEYNLWSGADGNFQIGAWQTGEHIFVWNDENSQCTYDGTVCGTITSIDQTGTHYLLGSRQTVNYFVYSGKIYYFKVTKKSTNTLEHDIRPVVIECNYTYEGSQRTATVSGVIDMITGEFYQSEYWTISST